MNLKSLLQPTIDKIREEVRKEEREKNTKIIESWLEKQIRAGKISEDVKPPVFGEDGKGKRLSSENGKKGK